MRTEFQRQGLTPHKGLRVRITEFRRSDQPAARRRPIRRLAGGEECRETVRGASFASVRGGLKELPSLRRILRGAEPGEVHRAQQVLAARMAAARQVGQHADGPGVVLDAKRSLRSRAASCKRAARRTGVRIDASGYAVLGLDLHADFLQEFRGQDAADADDHRVVGEFQLASLEGENDRRGSDALHLRFEQHLQAAGARRRGDALAIAGLGTGEGIAAIGQCDLPAAVLGDARRGLERAIAAADDEHVLSSVLLRIDQPVDHFRQVLPRHVEPPRRAAPPDRQQHARRSMLAPRRAHEESVALAADRLDALPVMHRQIHLPLDAAPELEQRLLRGVAETQPAHQRQRDRRGHHHLGPRVLEDAAAQRVLLDRRELQAVRHCRQRGRETGRAGTDDEQVERAGAACPGPLLVNRIDGLHAL